MSNSNSVKYRMLSFLANQDNIYNTFTVPQARARFRVRNVVQQVNALRSEGYAIYKNRKTLDDGRKIEVYRLGKPSKGFAKQFRAGNLQKAIAALDGSN